MSFVVHHKHRYKLMDALRAKGVDTTTGYMNNMSDHELFAEYRCDCPNAKLANAELLHIPVHPNLTTSDIEHLVESVRKSCAELQ